MTVRDFTAEDFDTLRAVIDPDLSRDGSRCAVAVGGPRPAWTDAPTADIWLADGPEEARPVTGGPGQHTLPRLSPSGDLLAYASDHEQPGLWRLQLLDLRDDAGTPRSFPALPGIVEDAAWASDESALMVRIADEGSDTGNVGGAVRFQTDDVKAAPLEARRPATAWRRLFRVDLETGAATEVGPEGVTVWDIGWAGHGPVAAVVSTDPSESGWYDGYLVLVDPTTRAATTVYQPQWQLQSPAVAEDLSRLVVLEAPQSDRALLAGQVVVIDLGNGGAVVQPDHAADITQVRWTSDGRIFWSGVQGMETACGFLVSDASATGGWRCQEQWRGLATLGRMYLVSATCSRDGAVLAAGLQAHGRPAELCTRPAGTGTPADVDWTARTSVNSHLLGRRLPTQSVHTWRADDGLEIQGLLLLPEDDPGQQAEGSRLPLVVVPHGGPTNMSPSVFASGAHYGDALLLTQAGCAVLIPNVRGSTGRGREFMSASLGDMGGGDLRDLEAGVGSLVEAGLVDPARVGIVGISYGGFMSAWAAVRSEVFAASVPIAGISNWLSFHNTSNLGRFDEIYLDGRPYDPAGPYLERSPVMYVEQARTPTLLLHGDLDLACPLGQAEELYRGLADAGCEVELVIYRGAGHGMAAREHVLDVHHRIVDWFTRHLHLTGARPVGE